MQIRKNDSVMVIAGGTMVCSQMRMTRMNSLVTSVLNATQFSLRFNRGSLDRRVPVFHQAYEQFLQPVGLVTQA